VSGPSIIDQLASNDLAATSATPHGLRTHSGRVRALKVKRPAASEIATAETETLPTTLATTAAASRQSAQLPAFAPLLEELEVAGWSSHRRALSGNFHDWSLLEKRTLLVLAGQTVAIGPIDAIDPIDAALMAQGAWASIRSHAQHAADAGTLLSLAARSLWSNVNSDLQIALAVAIVDLDGGHASVAVAGDCLALRVRAAGCDPIAAQQPMLGAISDFTYLSHSVRLSLRERILLIADDPQQRPAKLMSRIAASFARLDAETHRRMLAADAIDIARQEFEPVGANTARPAASIVAVRRR